MAVTAFRNGYTMTAATDALPNVHRSILKIMIVKTTAGTCTFTDGTNTVLVSDTIADGGFANIEMGGWVCPKLTYSAVSAGSAVVTVLMSEPVHANIANVAT